jgi:tetratricopeptide (TPR) repeat protein
MAVAARPRDPILHCELANALLAKKEPDAAAPVIQAALSLDPKSIMARHLEAAQCAQMGKVPEARRLYEALVEDHPESLASVLELAHLCANLGDFPSAVTHYRALLGSERWRVKALCALAEYESIQPGSPEALELDRLAAEMSPTAEPYGSVHYALGRIANNGRDYAAAIEHFAKSRRAAGVHFDIEAQRREFDAMRAIFTPAFFAERRNHGHPSDRPIFVVGMPRSGTTLTEQIIASHPQAAGANELPDIELIARHLGLTGNGRPIDAERILALTPEATRALAEQYLTVIDRVSATALRVSDKMHANFRHLGLIALLFPNARVIHARRDPLDTCVSCFMTTVNPKSSPWVADLGSMGLYYREYVRLMQYWHEALPLPIHDSQYEELVASFEERARGLVDFIGLPWDPACLSFHAAERAVYSASVMQVRQPIYATSVQRWRRYEKHLGPLIEALGDLAPQD